MADNFEKLYITRISRFIDRISTMILSESVPFTMQFWNCGDAIPFAERLQGDYREITEGALWGKDWESAWFHLEGEVPAEWAGQKICAHLDFGGEGLIYLPDGEFLQGITNGSVFDNEFARDIVHLNEEYLAKSGVELWIETAANGLFGMFTEPDPAVDSPHRYGHYEAKVNKARLCLFDDNVWHLWLDLKIIWGLIKTLPEKSVRRKRLIRCANKAIEVFQDSVENSNAARAVLKTELSKTADASELTAYAVGHAHIDTAWLWPVKETVRKCARTYANQLKLINEYPDYVFGASQPQHYQFIKDFYLELYEQIKQAVKEGKWELQGGMWVEADCNLICGESLIRQILYGNNFFRDEFGVEVENLWLPDVFGYSAALPQIMAKSGLKYFLTQKLSWNQFNEFPHHTFIWKGLDGSEVLTHFPPENTYNSQLNTEYINPGRDNFKEREFIEEFICLFGVGDGGGGPKEENIEFGLRMRDLEGAPKVKFSSAANFFETLDKYRDELAVWAGELYLEYHRGTLTTQARVKKYNRKLEYKLKAVEAFCSILPLKDYPQTEIETIWKKVLINQFHDIIPGSSINSVYENTIKEYEAANEESERILSGAAKRIFIQDKNAVTYFNASDYSYKGSLKLPEGWTGYRVNDEEGKEIFRQIIGGQSEVYLEIAPYSFKTLKKVKKVSESALKICDDLILENELIRYKFDEGGSLISAYDKECRREVIPAGMQGNVLSMYEDRPVDHDAWDVDIYYEDTRIENAGCSKIDNPVSGEVFQRVTFDYTVGKSTIAQQVTLTRNSKRLDFTTHIDWREKHKMLRVAFPVEVVTDSASYDIQYGYIGRPNHRNTPYDRAKFESVGHKFADLSDSSYGAALMNDCKYGYKVLGKVIDLNLLRSPTYPDPDADIGEHDFTYSFLPHKHSLPDSEVFAEAERLNNPSIMFAGYAADRLLYPFRVESESISLEAVKKAEKEDCLILRLVEKRGAIGRGKIILQKPGSICECDIMEWNDGEVKRVDCAFDFAMKPFEIKTCKLWFDED